MRSDSDDESSKSSSSSSSFRKDETGNTEIITAAELMRRRLGNKSENAKNTAEKKNTVKSGKEKVKGRKVEEEVDLDDEIKRLEAELAEDSSDSDSDSDSDSSSSDEEDAKRRKKRKIKFGDTTILNQEEVVPNDPNNSKEGCVICTSQFADDVIEALPIASLPKCKSKKLKIDFQGEEMNDDKSITKKSKKRKRSSTKNDNNNVQPSEGLRDAVLEVLQGYVPRSSERLPFYCRVCSHQSSTEEKFLEHKKTEFHKAAVQIERKKTYCKLCRKQLTSLVQMQEHLQSRPHREKLDFVKARQRGEPLHSRSRYNSGQSRRGDRDYGRGGRGGRGRGGGRNFGRGRGGRWQDHQVHTSNKNTQWC